MVTTIDGLMKNPFEVCIEGNQQKEPLVNIATGAVMSSDISKTLLRVKTIGEKGLNSFFENTIVSEDVKFNDPIRKLGIKTFTSLNKPIKTSKDKETAKLISADRQCFSRLLVVGQKRAIDLSSLLFYELSPVPPALCHLDGSLRKTIKSTLLHKLDMEHLFCHQFITQN